MTLAEILAQLRVSMDSRLSERATHRSIIDSVRAACASDSNRDPSTEEADRVRAATEAVRGIDAELAVMSARVTELENEQRADDAADRLSAELRPGAPAPVLGDAARVAREPRTYTAESSRRGEASFFVDAFRSSHRNDVGARDRIERHSREVIAEREYVERVTTTASYAGLVVPQYLVDQAALIARAGRPIANICQGLPLPDQGMSLIIPRGTTGGSVASQAAENTAVSVTDQVWANVTVPVVTVAGQAPVSRQSLERGTPGLDQLIYGDLAAAYHAELDRQVVVGTGASGEMLGISNTAGISQATAFTAAVTPATFYPKVAGAINAVSTGRFMPPSHVLMAPRRWAWLMSQVDSSNRPLAVPNQNGPYNAQAVYDHPDIGVVVGSFLGMPVVSDANIPLSVGTGPEDLVFVVRAADLLLWESGDGMPRELSFEQTAGANLTTTLVVYGYAAFTAARYPSAVAKVGSNGAAGFGLVAPTF